VKLNNNINFDKSQIFYNYFFMSYASFR